MEKVLSQEDRIRRAEEIYYKRKQGNLAKTATVNLNPKKEYKLFKKMAIQIIICSMVYFGVHGITSKENEISADMIKQIKNIINYDINFKKSIDDVSSFILGIYNNYRKDEQKDEIEETQEVEIQEVVEEQPSNIIEEKQEENMVIEDEASMTQMEKDAKYIKENFSLIKPVIGTITSRFGLRNPTTPTVPKYHTGIDIAVNEGTVFVAAMDGVVELVSSQGDYRKSY